MSLEDDWIVKKGKQNSSLRSSHCLFISWECWYINVKIAVYFFVGGTEMSSVSNGEHNSINNRSEKEEEGAMVKVEGGDTGDAISFGSFGFRWVRLNDSQIYL